MRKLKVLNALPVHQLCRRYLEVLGEEVSDESLYGLQLAVWGFENSDLTIDLDTEAAALDALIARLDGMEPEEAHQLLLGFAEGDDIADLEEGRRALLAAAEDAEEAATWLAEDLAGRLGPLHAPEPDIDA